MLRLCRKQFTCIKFNECYLLKNGTCSFEIAFIYCTIFSAFIVFNNGWLFIFLDYPIVFTNWKISEKCWKPTDIYSKNKWYRCLKWCIYLLTYDCYICKLFNLSKKKKLCTDTIIYLSFTICVYLAHENKKIAFNEGLTENCIYAPSIFIMNYSIFWKYITPTFFFFQEQSLLTK